MQAKLFSQTGATRGCELRFEDEAIIGRDAQNHLVIDQPLMSSRHARIAYDEARHRFVLEDLDSLNGTALDGDPITGPERLGHLHVITFADTYDFFFQDLERCARRRPSPAAAPEAATAADGGAEARVDRDDSSARVVAPEVTLIDREPIALPGFLARRAEAAAEQSPEGTPPEDSVHEVTAIEREPAVLPAALGRRADEERAAAGEPGGKPRAKEVTLREKLPVALPDILSQRAEAARRAETLDLDDIEELMRTDAESPPESSRRSDESSGLHLVVTVPDGGIRRFAIAEGENLIGRSSSVQVSMAYPDLSRRHAVLTVEGERITLRDLRSRNRTFLDDQPLAAEVETEVPSGARLRFGSIEARLLGAGRDEAEPGENPDER